MNELLRQFTLDIERYKHQPIGILMTLPEAFIILNQLQLTLRHPFNSPPIVHITEYLARQLQRSISITPALAAIAAAGWNHDHDQPTNILKYPPEDPTGLKVFNCPTCQTPNAVIENDTGFHCRECKQTFYEAAFDDWHDDTDDQHEHPLDSLRILTYTV